MILKIEGDERDDIFISAYDVYCRFDRETDSYSVYNKSTDACLGNISEENFLDWKREIG
ncbi:MAG: hypothetical protein HUJ68_11445 [Clostridia bacterium]|nr:hypothetical protein [Clostridia bacterium]